MHPHIGAATDAVFNVNYVKYNLDDTNNDVDGWGFGAGLRHMLTDQFELNGMINWTRASVDHVSNGDSTDVSWTVGGRYLVTPAISTGVTYTDGDNGVVAIDLRYQFADLF